MDRESQLEYLMDELQTAHSMQAPIILTILHGRRGWTVVTTTPGTGSLGTWSLGSRYAQAQNETDTFQMTKEILKHSRMRPEAGECWWLARNSPATSRANLTHFYL